MRTTLRKSLVLLTYLACFGLGLGQVQAADLVVGYSKLPPHFEEDETGGPKGQLLTTVLSHLKNLGHNVTSVVRPPARLKAELTAGSIDLAFGPRNRSEHIKSSKRPIWKTDLEIRWVDGNPGYRSIRSLYGRRVATLRGYNLPGFQAVLDAPNNFIELAHVNDSSQGVRMLLAGRVEYVMAFQCQFEEAPKSLLEATRHKTIGTTAIHLLARSSLANADGLLAYFDELDLNNILIRSDQVARPVSTASLVIK